MKIPQCEREVQVLNALQSGRWAGPWGEELRRHAAGCEVCSEVVLVHEALRLESRSAMAQSGNLPSAGLVWWKAQRAARRAAEARAAQPIALVARAAGIVGAATTLGVSWWQWSRISGAANRTVGELKVPGAGAVADWAHRAVTGLSQVGFGQTPAFLVAVSAVACLTLFAFAAYVVWREE